jgi:hypothetical protein
VAFAAAGAGALAAPHAQSHVACAVLPVNAALSDKAQSSVERFAHRDAAPPRDYNAGWHDCLSVRRCVNFLGAHDGVGGGDGPCPIAGRLVSRDGSAALSIAQRLMIDMCGLEVPANLRRVAGGRTKPPPLHLERNQR